MTSPIQSNSNASLEGIAADIRAHQRTTSHAVLAIGVLLQTAKEMVSHGEFSVWAQVKCRLSARSVQRYMRAARRLEGKADIVSLLQPSTIYALTAKRVDDKHLANILEQGRDSPLQDGEVMALLASARARSQVGPMPSQGGTDKLEAAWETFFGAWNAAEIEDMRVFCRLRHADVKEWLLSAATVAEQPPLSPEDILRQVLDGPSCSDVVVEETDTDEADGSRQTPDTPSPVQVTCDEPHPLDIPPELRRTA